MRRHQLYTLCALAATLVWGGCASGQSPIGDVRHVTRYTVLVENNNWMDMKIYLDRSGSRTLLGTVTSMERRYLRLPPIAATSLPMQLVADPIGATTVHRSTELALWPGRQVEWRIENNLSHSVLLMR
jgi:hypothetical protein